MTTLHRGSTDYSSIDDLSLPRGATASSFFKDQHAPILERSNSDSNLNLLSPSSWSCLSVDKSFVKLKDNVKDSAKVRVEWDVKEDTSAQDWIGLFLSGFYHTSFLNKTVEVVLSN